MVREDYVFGYVGAEITDGLGKMIRVPMLDRRTTLFPFRKSSLRSFLAFQIVYMHGFMDRLDEDEAIVYLLKASRISSRPDSFYLPR